MGWGDQMTRLTLGAALAAVLFLAGCETPEDPHADAARGAAAAAAYEENADQQQEEIIESDRLGCCLFDLKAADGQAKVVRCADMDRSTCIRVGTQNNTDMSNWYPDKICNLDTNPASCN